VAVGAFAAAASFVPGVAAFKLGRDEDCPVVCEVDTPDSIMRTQTSLVFNLFSVKPSLLQLSTFHFRTAGGIALGASFATGFAVVALRARGVFGPLSVSGLLGLDTQADNATADAAAANFKAKFVMNTPFKKSFC
jgi:hypothetical protein